MLILFVLSNPLVAIIIIVFYTINQIVTRSSKYVIGVSFKLIDRGSLLLILFSCLYLLWIIINIIFPGKVMVHNETFREDYLINSLIEIITARSILYPYIEPFYNIMTNIASVCVFIVYITIVSLAFYFDNKGRKDIFTLATITLLLAVLVPISRPELTHYILNYMGTFPDRYFYAQNILSVTLLIFALERLKTHGYLKYITYGTLIAMFVFKSMYINHIIEFNNPKLKLMKKNNFADTVSVIYSMKDRQESYRIPVYFEGWEIELPAKYVVKTDFCNQMRKSEY